MVMGMALVVLLLAACARPSAEERLRAQVAALQQTIQKRETGDAMALVTEDFAGNNGMDRQALHNLLRAQFLTNADVGATVGPLDLALQGDHATVRFSVLLTGGSSRWLPEQAGAYQVTTGWRIEDGDWKLYLAQWQPR